MMGVFNDLAFLQADNVFSNQVTAGKISNQQLPCMNRYAYLGGLIGHGHRVFIRLPGNQTGFVDLPGFSRSRLIHYAGGC
jgi:hypothetical protein